MDDIELQPPTVASPKHTGLVLDIAALSIHNPLAGPGEITYPFIRCTDHRVLRLPEPLHRWATETIALSHATHAAGAPPLFPGQVEFGILDGIMYAEIL
ncbi:hypothetical protein [Nocardia amamiensis]|uniref:Uncharacterized protein n=1 Tax=Nocardia amamiensis TaxID=404578 RepID=A0ABS0CX23_9NOCA|nr:hypothetical protein [Nocardia amamiensis]MBF6301132.1 hypothetical protein [Nocardia amamiensis]